MKHVKIVVTGRVQGVFYRVSAKEKADELGLVGLVRNEPNGSVYMEVEGESNQIDSFVAWCEQGSKLATIKEVSVAEGEIKGYDDFEVR